MKGLESEDLQWVVVRGPVQSAVESGLVLAITVYLVANSSPLYAQVVIGVLGATLAICHVAPQRIGVDADRLVQVSHWRRHNYDLTSVERVSVYQTARTATALYIDTDVDGRGGGLGPVFLSPDVRPFIKRLAEELERHGQGHVVEASVEPYLD